MKNEKNILRIGAITVSLTAVLMILSIIAYSIWPYAASDAQKTIFLSAGEALLTRFHGSGWYLSLFLTAISQVISSILMMKSPFFMFILDTSNRHYVSLFIYDPCISMVISIILEIYTPSCKYKN